MVHEVNRNIYYSSRFWIRLASYSCTNITQVALDLTFSTSHSFKTVLKILKTKQHNNHNKLIAGSEFASSTDLSDLFLQEGHRTNMYIRLSKLVLFVFPTNFNGGTQFLIENFVDWAITILLNLRAKKEKPKYSHK